MFEIRNNVPLPEKDSGNNSKRNPASFHGTLRRMEIGDSIIVHGKKQYKVSSAISGFMRFSGLPSKFTTRKLDDGSVGVWRVA